jgi:hypothetical protein
MLPLRGAAADEEAIRLNGREALPTYDRLPPYHASARPLVF